MFCLKRCFRLRARLFLIIFFGIFILHFVFPNPFSAPPVIVEKQQSINKLKQDKKNKVIKQKNSQNTEYSHVKYQGFGEFNGKFYAQIEVNGKSYFVKEGSVIEKYFGNQNH